MINPYSFKLISDVILELPNTSIIIVGLAEADAVQYAAFVDLSARHPITETYKGYINIVQLSKSKDVFRDALAIYNDEEWLAISDFFDKSGVFEMNRIERWVWAKVYGVPLIPKWMYPEADKKRRKVIGTLRKEIGVDLIHPDDKYRINWGKVNWDENTAANAAGSLPHQPSNLV